MQYALRKCRIAAGYSQEKAANEIGTVQHHIHRYESGEVDIPLSRAIQLADLYNVSLDELAGRKYEQSMNFGTMEQQK